MKKKLFYIYSIVFIIMLIIYKIILNYNQEIYKSELINEAKNIEDSTNKDFDKFIDLIKFKLDAIDDNETFKSYVLEKNSKEHIEELFLTMIKQTPVFYQIRYIDNNGNEQIRVEQTESNAIITEKNYLQNKSDRYYFKETMKLIDKDYFISKIDLNEENGKYEIPYRPTLRVSKLLKNNNEKKGILVVNINMKEFLNEFIENKKFDIYLIDKEGFLLTSNTKDKQWERYLANERINKSFILNKSIKKELNLDNEDKLSILIKINDEYFETLMSSKMKNIIILLAIFYHLVVLLLFYKIYQSDLEERIKKAVNENLEKEKILSQQQKLASMGEMLENIAHQWRQPLSVISTLASGLNLMLKLDSLKKEEAEKSFDEIVKQTSHLSKTIEIFRNFIKEEKNYLIVNLEDRLKLTLEILDPIFKDNNIHLINKINFNSKHEVKLVTGELSQVIINIVNNAKDVFKEREIIKPIIELDLIVNDNNIVLTIEDNAGGIAEEILPRIFEPYFTTKHSSHGTGIGLHMAYNIVKNSIKGDIYAKNTETGAKFFIEIPIIIY